MTVKRAHVLVSGKVQGVGYRYSTIQQASKLGLNGWVQNLEDGRVEAVFEGNSAAIEQILAWCQRGPKSAVVTDVTVEIGISEGIEGFEMRR